MIHDLKSYPAMKDSGVPWLGEVPEHWEVKPLKRWVRINKQVLPETTPPDFNFRYLDIGSVGTGLLTQAPQPLRFGAAPSRARRILRPGDTIMSTVRTYLKAVWFVEAGADDMIGSTGFAVFTPTSGTDAKYVSYLAQSNTFTDRVSSESTGITYPAIAEGRVASFQIGVPPLPEQSAIVRFLDYTDRRIRRSIRAKQKLIKLLEEQKQVIIVRAVTCGLDPNGPTQPLGSAPECRVSSGWKISRLWKVSCLRSEKGRPELDLLSVFLGRGVIRYGEGGGQVHKPSLDLSGYQVVHLGDLVLNNQQAWRGSVGVSTHQGIISPAYVVLALNSSLHSHFADYLFKSRVMVSQFVTASKGVGDIQRDIHMPWLRNIRVPIPSLTEQYRITDYLDRELAGIGKQLSLFDRELSLLREYRTRLIADVVTGKVDVRGVAASLPKEADELETHDETDAEAEGNIDSAEGNLDVPPEEAEV